MQRALGELDDRYRTVLILRYWRDLTPAEIAKLLAEPEGTIRNRIFRAHARLRRRLESFIEDATNRGSNEHEPKKAPPHQGMMSSPGSSPAGLPSETGHDDTSDDE